MTEEETSFTERKPLPFLPFAVQLQNVFTTEILARRFPVNMSTFNLADTQVGLSLEGIDVNEELLQAQVILSMQLFHSGEPHVFEMAFKLVGLFTYSQEYRPELVRDFLEQGSLSILLPFARELVLSLSTRLQLPPILLPLVQVEPPPTNDVSQEGTPQ
jgi:preprotein translocase subunit SecB